MQKIASLTKQRKIVLGIGIPIGLLMLCCCGGVIFTFTPVGQAMVVADHATATAQARAAAHATATAAQYALLHPTATTTPKPTAMPKPTSTPIPILTTQQVAAKNQNDATNYFTQLVKNTLGDGNRSTPRVASVNVEMAPNEPGTNPPPQCIVSIQWAINDNITNGLIFGSAQEDAFDLTKALFSQNSYKLYAIELNGTFSMMDQLGNASEQKVVSAIIPVELGSKVNWDNETTDLLWSAFQDGIEGAMLSVDSGFHS